MPKKILIIDANPSKFGFTACLAEEYAINAEESGFEVKTLCLRDMKFDPILHYGYSRVQKLEPDLEKAQDLIKWCEHLVLVTPVWWYSAPALLKGFFDRVMLPGFAFEVELMPKRKVNKLLSGRTATLFYTYGGPKKNMDKITGRINGIIAVGYGATQGVPHKSKSADEISQYKGTAPQWFKDGVDALLCAPTALNKQAYMVKGEGRKVSLTCTNGHFAGIDLGIGKYHFEIGAGKENFQWVQ